jgi:hypothetical protein
MEVIGQFDASVALSAGMQCMEGYAYPGAHVKFTENCAGTLIPFMRSIGTENREYT